ncbi:MAG: HAMP domain-containing sensor histidine kinase [Myxococcota bacterium]
MGDARAGPSEYALRALLVVLGAGAVHAVLALILLQLLVGEGVLRGQQISVALSVTVTALAELAFLYVRTQYASPDHVARTLPWVSWTTPAVASVALGLVAIPPDAVDTGLRAVLLALTPVLAASWSVGLVVGIVLDRQLRALAATYPRSVEDPALIAPAPPTLSYSYIRIVLACTLAAAIVAVASVFSHPAVVDGTVSATRSDGWLWIAALLLLIGWAPFAATTLGMSPGADIRSIARRLDAHGYGAADVMRAPVVVTHADEVGQLLASLEALRSNLHDEMSVYEEALERTRAADARKANFLNAVSHELRTPLNAVGGFAQLLLENVDVELNPSQREDVELIRDGGRQLLELINDILDMSMIESGELRLSFASTDVAALVRSVVKIHQPLVDERVVTLQAEIGPGLPSVVCDARRLRQILTNLVSNAIKFTEKGAITLRVAHDARRDAVVIRCIDTGVGIAEDDLVAIFEEYRQVGSVKRRSKGTGLGLAIARRIARHHGGTLRAESTPGEGSVFTLRLPLEPPARPEAINIAEEDARARTLRPTVSGDSGIFSVPESQA